MRNKPVFPGKTREEDVFSGRYRQATAKEDRALLQKAEGPAKTAIYVALYERRNKLVTGPVLLERAVYDGVLDTVR